MPDPYAAVAILHAVQPVESILLMRRAERLDDPWSGHWSFPGGRRDPVDTDLLCTALRELNEECGITLRREDLEESLEPMNARRRTGPLMLVAPFVFHLDSQLDAVPDQMEAVEARWLSLNRLRTPSEHRLAPIPNVPGELLFPSVAIAEMPLWGFTYRILMEWLGLLPPVAERRNAVRRVCAELEGLDRDAALQRLQGPWPEIPPVSMVEVNGRTLRVSGLAMEFYEVALAG